MCCCHGQLGPFPGATCQPLVSLAAKCRKLQAMTLLPLEIRKAAYHQMATSLKLSHQSSAMPYPTVLIIIVSIKFTKIENDIHNSS